MTASTVDSLLAAVRRRLWWSEFVAATRRASWATAALMLVAAAMHLALRPVGVRATLLAVVVVWTAMAARAAWRRPAAPAAALWADRHLGGTSAFSTWIEMRNGTEAAHAPALAWLEQWVIARVSDSRRMLAARRDAARLARPLVSMLVCAAFAAVVLASPDLVPSPQAPVPRLSTGVEQSASGVQPDGPTQLVGELARAVRAGESRASRGRAEVGSAPTPPRKVGDDTEPGKARSDSGTPDKHATIATAPATRGEHDARSIEAAGAAAAGAGRAAGDNPDDRADAGSSRAARGTMPLATRPSGALPSTPSRQADMEQAATFDEDAAMESTVRKTDRIQAAAPPPAAAATADLTPTQAAYVRAWTRATGPRR